MTLPRVFLSHGVVLYLGAGFAADAHSHHAVQLVLGHDELMIELDGRRRRSRAVLVPANVRHAFDASNTTIALMLFERHLARGIATERAAKGSDPRSLEAALAGVTIPSRGISASTAMKWCDDVLSRLGVVALSARGLTRATRDAIAYVDKALPGTPRLADAAAIAGLSPSRLTHRFTAELGIPFRRFVVWSRLLRAVDVSRRGASLTEAAVESGFSDVAHLSRAFRATFGLTPSSFLPWVELVASPGWVPAQASSWRPERSSASRPAR
ncbi:MAG: helix-turn-helix transcriptional regulator [Polyangiaceae bacterium]|nr:helix-turn-helix transcriptional regulator [Polyangiaceae bacterium]